ncbi:hypothetical protein [Nodosilinea sp. E11]|uniref:hypothetical protein n=1 Tax=Nodosilinea sp. E11 TaxID=3037479 RepID=UPI0029343C67|nr:hypothetical protein [Nodosilinea sp. E11]WOD37640.1 hypothetical protein RRF56_15635 [Nodosilinea sp. E11]
MDDSPFRRIVLPALLASSAGFAALTWPMASDSAARLTERLPAPLDRWGGSALSITQHKEFSIRYIGFAILSSVAIGIGTAETMRLRQVRVQRHQGLLDAVLAKTEADRPLADSPDLEASSTQVLEPKLADINGAADAETAPGDRAADAFDWASFVQATPINPDQPAAVEVELLATPIEGHRFYHIQSGDQHRCLAVANGGEYFRYYRHRPDLDKARSLVQELQRRGQRSMTTCDDHGYVVWVHWPNAAAQARPWPELAVSS